MWVPDAFHPQNQVSWFRERNGPFFVAASIQGKRPFSSSVLNVAGFDDNRCVCSATLRLCDCWPERETERHAGITGPLSNLKRAETSLIYWLLTTGIKMWTDAIQAASLAEANVLLLIKCTVWKSHWSHSSLPFFVFFKGKSMFWTSKLTVLQIFYNWCRSSGSWQYTQYNVVTEVAMWNKSLQYISTEIENANKQIFTNQFKPCLQLFLAKLFWLEYSRLQISWACFGGMASPAVCVACYRKECLIVKLWKKKTLHPSLRLELRVKSIECLQILRTCSYSNPFL